MSVPLGAVLGVVLGGSLGAGLLLVLAPVLRPRRPVSERRSSRRAIDLLADLLERAGIGVPPALFATVSVLVGCGLGTVVEALAAVPMLALVAAAVGALAPAMIARWRARARRRAARSLWPEVVDHLVAALRAGRPMPEAIAELASAGPAPFRPAFARFDRTWQRTGTLALPLDELKQAVADPTADRIIETLRMAREVGGTELPGVLRDLAVHLRQDLALRAEAEARQSWVTNAAKLGVVAPWLVLLLLATRPEAAAAYNTPQGVVLMAAALVVTVAAYRGMLAIGRLPEDRRWFR